MKYLRVFGLFLALLLLMLAACGTGTAPSGPAQSQTTPSRSAPGSQEVRVTLSDNKITSSLATFTTGKPYHFVVINTGNVAHQFVMVPMGMGLGRMSADEMHRAALFMYESVAPGETRTFNYTFSPSTAGQRFKFACGTQGHYGGAEMQLPFIVNPQ